MKRVILIVLDGCGAGEAPDAAAFGDLDHPATLRHVWEHRVRTTGVGLNAPHLAACGLFAAAGISEGIPAGAPHPSRGRYGRLQELSAGKDSVTGHWEMMGIRTDVPFPTYPLGFPASLVAEFEARIGRGVLGNCAASGTEIISRLGEEHLATGRPILYTSADSVFQVAAHESVVGLEQLYSWCEIGRAVCTAPDNVQRVIARPFAGALGHFERTGGRKDFPLTPPPNFVDAVGDVLGPEAVIGIGVVPELFSGRGFRPSHRTTSNAEHAVALRAALASDARFIFANFEDFDMLYGHRNDPAGFGSALEAFDIVLGELLAALTPDDLLMLTADHGNDPTTPSTDHTREFVPLCLVRGDSFGSRGFGDVEGMASVALTAAHHLGIPFDPGFGRPI